MSKKTKFYQTLTLMLIDGNTIEVTYPDDIAEQLFKEMTDAIRSGQPWHVGSWDEVRAEYAGMVLDNINTRLIVGWR